MAPIKKAAYRLPLVCVIKPQKDLMPDVKPETKTIAVTLAQSRVAMS